MPAAIKTPNLKLNDWQPADITDWQSIAADNMILDEFAAKTLTTDYEENGVFFPKITGSTTQGNNISLINDGWYYQIGKQITIGFQIVVNKSSWDATTSGNILIGPLPVVPKSPASCGFSVVNGVDISKIPGAYQLMGVLKPGNNYISLAAMVKNLYATDLDTTAIQDATGNIAFFGSATYLIN